MTESTARAAIGLVVPSTNTTVEREITKLMPSAAAWFVARVLQVETQDPREKVRTVLAMQEELGAASERLSGLGPAAFGFACTAASFLDGIESDRTICADFSARLKVPFITASSAIRRALGALDVTSMALVTPYIDEVNEREIDYFRSAGISTVASSGLGIVGNLPKGRLPLSASAEAARSTPVGGADALVISCTNWLTFDNLEPLGDELGLPVVSSNSALAWALLRAAGVSGPLAGLGALENVPMEKESTG